MKIEIEVDDLKAFIDGFNNACAAYGDIISALFLGCAIPRKFEVLKTIPYDIVEKRFKCLKMVYNQLLNIEKEVLNENN